MLTLTRARETAILIILLGMDVTPDGEVMAELVSLRNELRQRFRTRLVLEKYLEGELR